MAKVHQAFQVTLRRDYHATFTLHRLDKYGTGQAWLVGRLYCVQVVVWNIHEAGHEGAPVVLVVRLARGGHHGLGATVERVERGDDLVGAVELQLSPFAGEFCCTFIGFSTRIAEEHAVNCRVVDDQLRKRKLWDRVEQVGHLQDLACLVLDGFRDLWMAVSQVQHGPSGSEVQVFLAVIVEDLRAFPANQHRRHSPYDLHVVLGF